ncbi:uncharacterized protein LOC141678090 [Apium graveolens]|uniref:uncharacterized protein LOC141678090 n=1 Tax=Apium graveolens TaxID=4045 RepID=UPI003D7B6F46
MASQEYNYMEPWNDLSDKVVMVTGASSGLGRECCLDLAKTGCKIIAAARRIDRLVSLCNEINGQLSDVQAVAIELDVSANSSAIEASVKKAWNAFGRIDALINNAGVRGTIHSPLALTEEEWDDTHTTNVKGAWLVSKHVCILMRDSNQGGSVINISSIAGLNRGHVPGSLAYSSSKMALNAITKVFALELGMYKIRVNSINPGLFESEITQNLMQKDWLNKVALRTVPLKQWNLSDPALTSLIRFLVHDSSNYVSGNNFIVDAGATLPGVPLFSSL